MQKFLTSYYLEAIGIQTWSLSKPLPISAQTVDFEAYDLCNSANETIGKLCLEKLPINAMQQAPFFKLLDAMLLAVQLKRVPMQDFVIRDNNIILLMGQSLAQEILNDSKQPLDELRKRNIHVFEDKKLLVTYHPLDLLMTPILKAKAWEDLKKLL